MVAGDHPDFTFTDIMVDALGLALVRGDLPRAVVVLDNQYGDILSNDAGARERARVLRVRSTAPRG